MHVAERFAIDFVQLNDKNMLIVGPMEKRSSYAYFGDEIYSVADGTVVGTADGLKEQVPGKLPADATIHMAAGNHVVVDIGEGRFAFYAHMQTGSVRVKVGDKVKTGQVLGLLGNSQHRHAASPLPRDGWTLAARLQRSALRVHGLYRARAGDRRAASVDRRRRDHRQGCARRTA